MSTDTPRSSDDSATRYSTDGTTVRRTLENGEALVHVDMGELSAVVRADGDLETLELDRLLGELTSEVHELVAIARGPEEGDDS